jgi:hypothetical protein
MFGFGRQHAKSSPTIHAVNLIRHIFSKADATPVFGRKPKKMQPATLAIRQYA